jgi:DNA-binding transcriptional ArsR family regulator
MSARRDAIVAAVAAHNRSHKPLLPNSAVRLLEAMFTSDDVCELSLYALEDAAGLSHKSVQTGLRRLLAAGIIVQEEKGGGRHTSRYRLLLTAGGGA